MEPLTVNHLFSFLFAALAGDCVGKCVCGISCLLKLV